MGIMECQLVEVTQTEINILEGLWDTRYSLVVLSCKLLAFIAEQCAGTSALLNASGQCIFLYRVSRTSVDVFVGYMDMTV
jgi:hypothetical protein